MNLDKPEVTILESKQDIRKYSFCAGMSKIWNIFSNFLKNLNNANSYTNVLDNF